MKKIVLAMAATTIVGFASSAQATVNVCVFDLLGRDTENRIKWLRNGHFLLNLGVLTLS